ncbi:unnamed protein product, partial [Prunus brigantina]
HSLSLSLSRALLPLRVNPPLLLFIPTETTTQPPHPTTPALETGPVRLFMKPRTRTTQNPDRKPRNPATVWTGLNRKIPVVAPPPPPPNSGETVFIMGNLSIWV